MADYKDIIQGTLNKVVSKVKDVAENGTVRDIYDKGVDRAKACGRFAKLSLEMNGESEELKRVYTEIGRLFYEEHKDGELPPYYASLFASADEIREKLKEMDEELSSMREDFEEKCDEEDLDVEICNFEDIVDAFEVKSEEDKDD